MGKKDKQNGRTDEGGGQTTGDFTEPVVEQLGRPGVFRIFGEPRIMAEPIDEVPPLSYWSREEGRRLGYDT